MSITYNYEVVQVDTAARVMEVVYTSEGRQTMHISARLPYEGETLEAVIDMFSPVAYWRDQEAALMAVEVGANGTLGQPPVVTLESAKSAKLAEISDWRFRVETSGIVFNGASIRTDRESQAQLAGAYSSLRDGILTAVNWKTSSGAFVSLGLTEIAAIAGAVAQHVQSCFDAEMALVQQVQQAQTIEAVNAIVLS